MRFERRLLALVSLAVFASIVFASVFVYYPASITVSPVSPPVQFAPGSNANQDDLGYGNKIAVSIGPNAASLAVTIHPTYQVAYYKNITIIKNVDSRAYYVNLSVQTHVQIGDTGLPQGSQLILYIYNAGGARSLSGHPQPTPSGSVASLDLTQSGYLTTSGSTSQIMLSSGSWLELDVYVYIPEGTTLPSSVKADLLLVYTPSTETPP
jgi:hypothetical protein